MLPFESTTRQVGAGVSGTLKSGGDARMLFPFSMACVAVPVLAFGPWNIEVVWLSPLLSAANETLAANSVTRAKTDRMRLIFTSFLLDCGVNYGSTTSTAWPSGS